MDASGPATVEGDRRDGQSGSVWSAGLTAKVFAGLALPSIFGRDGRDKGHLGVADRFPPEFVKPSESMTLFLFSITIKKNHIFVNI